ncbi:MAG: hypothetical protein ACK42D_03240 [Candidatus Paceibacteria bacterium]
MKWLFSILVVLLLPIGVFFWLNDNRYIDLPHDEGQSVLKECRDFEGFSFNEMARACVRESDVTPNIVEATRLAVLAVGDGELLTLVSFNSYEEEGAFDIFFERGEERDFEIVYIRGWEVVTTANGGGQE